MAGPCMNVMMVVGDVDLRNYDMLIVVQFFRYLVSKDSAVSVTSWHSQLLLLGIRNS
jgi:hypothetical protein